MIYNGGSEGFVEFIVEWLIAENNQSMHHLGNMLIDIQDDIAYAESYVMAFHRLKNGGDPQDLHVGARFNAAISPDEVATEIRVRPRLNLKPL